MNELRRPAMSDPNFVDAKIRELQSRIDLLKTTVSILAAIVVAGFSAGILWTRLLDYEQKIDKQATDIEKNRDDIRIFKDNLGNLGILYNDIPVEDMDSAACDVGGAVVGLSRRGTVWKIRCASVGRAAWNPNPSPVSTAR